MKCLSVKQPFADFIFDPITDRKTIETRVWPTNYRGPVLICASATYHKGQYLYFERDGEILSRQLVDCSIFEKENLFLLGHAIGVVDVVDCRPMVKDDEMAALCEIYPGAFSWVLENPRRIEPIPVKGQLRLWDYRGPELVFQ